MYVGSSASSPSLRRHHPGKVPRQVDVEVVPAPSAQEGVPGPVHQHRRVGGLGGDRQRARLDAGPHA